MRKFALQAVLVMALFVPIGLSAQTCALCYTQAAGAGEKMITALKSGILVLVFPPMGICVALTVIGYRKRNRFHSLEDFNIDAEKENCPNADLGW